MVKEQQINCIIDCRISSTKQQSGGGLDDQNNVCVAFVGRQGWNTLRTYSKVYSGRAEERKDFEEILTDIIAFKREGIKVDKYVVKSIDRFTRDGAVTYDEMKNRLTALDVQLADAYGVIQPEQNTLQHLGFEYKWSKRSPTATAQLAEAQRAKDDVTDILTRMIGAEIASVKQGYKIRQAEDGFVNKRVIIDGQKRMIEIPDTERARFYIEMFNLRALGTDSDEEIANKINALGYRSRIRNRWDKKHTKIIATIGGNPLTVKELQKKIRRVIYAGIKCEKWTHNLPIKAQYDGLVSIDTFNRANRGKIFIDYQSEKDIRILYDYHPERNIGKRMKDNPLFPYKWAVLCTTCHKSFIGSATVGKSKKKFPAYYCARGHKRFSVRKKIFDDNVERFITNLKFDPDYLSSLEATFLNKYQEREKEILGEAIDINRTIADLQAEQLAKVNEITASTSAVVKRLLAEKVDTLEIQIKQAKEVRNQIEITEDDIKAFMRDAKQTMEHPAEMLLNAENPMVQRALFGLVFEEVPTYDELISGTPKLTWVFKLSSDFVKQNSQYVRAEGVEPPAHSV